MNTSLSSTNEYQQGLKINEDVQQRMPESLRRQARLTACLFFAIWLLLSVPIFLIYGGKFVDLLALLPSLAIAWYMQHILSVNLSKNHRPDEPGNVLPNLGAGNYITLARTVAVIGLATLLPLAVHNNPGQSNLLGWLGGSLYLVISLADLLDGYAARRQQQVTELGKELDMETDAVGLLAASLIAIYLGRLPEIYLLVGLAYYFFKFGMWWRNRHGIPITILRQRPYGRIIAGCQMGLVALVFMPVFAPLYTHTAAVIFMIPLLVGFLRDWLVVSCRLATDDNQKSRLDLVWGRGVKRIVSLLVRLVIAFCGVMLIMVYDVTNIGLVWLTASSVCYFLIVVGCVGRCSALLLVLVLAYNQSPFGIDVLPILLFSGAAVLVVIGSGPMSLWSPEDDILYRR